MAVKLSVLEAAADRRIGDGVTPLEEPELGILTRLLETASELVESYAGPTTPQSIMDTAASLVIGYLLDQPVSDGTRYANCLANSGAQLLLSRWEVRRAVIVGRETTP